MSILFDITPFYPLSLQLTWKRSLYDKLVDSNKLDVSWEISIEAIQIAERRKGSEVEKVVSFSKKTGDPRTVYIFFTSHGEYAGSNLTGQ